MVIYSVSIRHRFAFSTTARPKSSSFSALVSVSGIKGKSSLFLFEVISTIFCLQRRYFSGINRHLQYCHVMKVLQSEILEVQNPSQILV